MLRDKDAMATDCPTRMTLRGAAAALGTRIFNIPFSSAAFMLSVSISSGNSNSRDEARTGCSRWMYLWPESA
jgi:hypothetical protein